MEQRYDGRWTEAFLADYCWSVCRGVPELTRDKLKDSDLMNVPHDFPQTQQICQRYSYINLELLECKYN